MNCQSRWLFWFSLNCCGMPGTEFARRMPKIARRIREVSPDLVALQEVFLERTARKLATASGLPFAFHARRLGTVAGGLVLLSRFPLSETTFIPFEEQGSLFRYSVLARLNRKGFLFARLERPRMGIVATHLLSNYLNRFDEGPYADWQQHQVEQLLDFIAELESGLPLLLVGDLNFHPRTSAYRRLRSTGLADLMEGCASPSMVPKTELDLGWLAPSLQERLDYVMLRPAETFSAVRCGYMFEGEGLSDHLGLLAELKLANSRQPRPEPELLL
jgi:endonuclease/exonuclease/phosphatase family metal-dependent hydrolase